MPKVIGAAGRYATERSINAFQRMLKTTMFVMVGIGVFEGALVASVLFQRGLSISTFIAGLMGLGLIWKLCDAQNRRIEAYERERVTWRTGAEGERAVGTELMKLPKGFVVFHDFNTTRGNFDHLVIGPTGIFAIETKNWRGAIGATAEGELTQDGNPSSQPYVKQLTGRIMAVRQQVLALSGKDVFIKALMVFPKARVNAKFGTTRSVYCLRDGRLCEHIENAKVGHTLTTEDVEIFTRAFQGIAGMDAAFREAA